MPIAKGSSMLSLGTWKARSTKYQRFLNLTNVFMLIVSTILLFTSGVLITFYHLTKLEFWSWYFYACPMCMLALGLYTFSVSVYGFLISSQESRGLISLVAVFFSIAFFVQIFSVFTAFELRSKITREAIPTASVIENMRSYGVDDTTTSNWDTMQKNLRCCGGLHFGDGFNTWSGILGGDVPDSCCHQVSRGCGKRKLTDLESSGSMYLANLGIWKDGCLEILHLRLVDEVVPLLLVYSGVGALLAIVELITVVLACSYIAQISRRRSRDKMFTRVTSNPAPRHQVQQFLPSLTNNETNF